MPLSSQATIEYELAKLNNSLSNYTQRQTYYYIISPIEGRCAITKSDKVYDRKRRRKK